MDRIPLGKNTLTVGARTLHKRLNERGILRSTESNRDTLTVRRTIEGRRRNVLHLHQNVLSTPPGTDQTAHGDKAGESGQVTRAGSDERADRGEPPNGEEAEPEMPGRLIADEAVGQVGQVLGTEEGPVEDVGVSVVSSLDNSDQDLTKRAPARGGHLVRYARDQGLEPVEEPR